MGVSAVPVHVAGTSSAVPVQVPAKSNSSSEDLSVLSLQSCTAFRNAWTLRFEEVSTAFVRAHPVGQEAVPSVLPSRSQVGVLAVPLQVTLSSSQPAGQPSVPELYAQMGVSAVPVHAAGTSSAGAELSVFGSRSQIGV